MVKSDKIQNNFDKNKNSDYLNEYNLAGNKQYKKKNNKISRQNKCKSGLDYINKNKGYF